MYLDPQEKTELVKLVVLFSCNGQEKIELSSQKVSRQSAESVTMESFLSNLGPHVSSLLNMMVMKRVNTGDRMLDGAIQMIATTLLTALVTAVIHLSTKGRWKMVRGQLCAMVYKGAYNPLEFDPATAPEKPANGVNFMYRKKLGAQEDFVAWFFTHHMNKFFATKNHTMIMPNKTMMDNIMDSELTDHSATENFEPDDQIPIWKHHNGYFVFVKMYNSNLNLYSDSCEALKECYNNYIDFSNERTNFTMEKRKKKNTAHIQSIHKFSNGDATFIGQIHSKKTFDSLFFTEKESILSTLTAFRDKTLYPAHLPVDNKLGIMLYGPPGTGKTGFISALANFLQRPVLMVHMSRITTRKAFDQLLENTTSSRFIYVFEEFDCMPGVQRRGDTVAPMEQDETAANGNLAMAMMMSQMSSKKDAGEAAMEEYRKEREASLDKLDLGYILTKLDGLESADDRIMVATTNHPERIDPALLRPGRFGTILNLSRCTKQMLVDMICFTYQINEKDRPRVTERVKDIPDLKWSPAEVLQLTITKKCHEELIEYLRVASPTAF